MSNSVTVVLTATKVADASNGRRYLVAQHGSLNHGGSICVFSTKGNAGADEALRTVKEGDTVTLVNIGIAGGKVYVYDDSTVQVAS